MFNNYLQNIHKTLSGGDATERSFYPDLKNLIENFLELKGHGGSVTIESRVRAQGIPDFTIRKNKQLIGYIEAKDISVEDLQTVANTEQLNRYKTKPNLILTNFCDFWLWRDGQWVKRVRIAMPRVLNTLKLAPPLQNEKELAELLEIFVNYNIPETKTAKNLAIELAHRAKLLPNYIISLLEDDKEEEIDRIYNAFKEFLIVDLKPDDFADIYAQTITYGLFTARLRQTSKEKFTRFDAQNLIPKNIKILYDTFSLISSHALPEQITWIVDDIATILAFANIERIKDEIGIGKGEGDPLIHFYETFLGEYDQKKRKSLGVYYTPLPVVSFITRSVNELLKDKFQIASGLSDSNIVTLLDPAGGTLTFIAEAIKIAVKENQKYSESSSGLKQHFLDHFNAFEILMASYVIGHLRMVLLFEDLDLPMSEGERFPLFLTNSLDFRKVIPSNLPFVADLAQEAEDAKKVKEQDILVILGNPPYTAEKKEAGVLPEWIKEKLKDYATGLGVEDEKKKGVLQDDYIRFIRLAHWKINQYGKGIFAYITNNSYLDGIIHRSMRKQLVDSFNEIYILNLHGNSRIKEKAPDGSKDENVFDIQQGVSIAIFVKTGQDSPCKVYYKDIWGLRSYKYDFLNSNTISQKDFELIAPQPNEYYFTKQDYSLKNKWESWLGLDQIFTQFVSGVETKRDNLAVDFEKHNLKNNIERFQNAVGDDEMVMKSFDLSEKSDLNITLAKQKLQNIDIDSKIIHYSYRPFDNRWLFYDESLVSRTRKPLMDCLLDKNNLCLLAMREYHYDAPYSHALITNKPVDRRIFISNRGAAYIFPLNVSIQEEQKQIFNNINCNLSVKFWSYFEEKSLGPTVPADQIFYYIYAILYSNAYRKKYNTFLRQGFPHIAFTKDGKLFANLSNLGKRLSDLHLLKSQELDNPVVKFKGQGDNRIERIEFLPLKMDQGKSAPELVGGCVWINETQYFGGVNEFLWNYYIGGYQVLHKWLKDRKGRALSSEDIKHYCKMVTALSKTIDIQKEIDKRYPEVEKALLE